MPEKIRHPASAVLQDEMIVVIYDTIAKYPDFKLFACFLQIVQELSLILVAGKYIFSIDPTIHSMVICTFISYSYTFHGSILT
jgi:hypothetical protein